ncbi:MAG: hypothetical protein HFI93_04780 [Lachnospiraceae bacterium]|nr:hypothetical protein [Lachnospiraceae bacterium]
MRNEERKLSFLETYKGAPEGYVLSIFRRAEEFEEAWDKDVADFSRSQIIGYLRGLNSTSAETLRVKTSILRQYTNFCRKKGLAFENHYNEIGTEELERCVNRFLLKEKYISPERLKELLEKMTNDCDRFLFLALYEGLGSYGEEYEEITLTKASGIKEHSILLCTGRDLPVSEELIKYARLSAAQEAYVTKGESLNGMNNQAFDKSQGLILNPRRNCRYPASKSYAYKRITTRVAKVKKDLNAKYLSIPRLQLSGMCTEFRRIMKENGLTYYEAFPREDMQAVIERYGYQNMVAGRLYAAIRGYLD